MANRHALDRALQAQVGDRCSLLRFATLAALYDPRLYADRMPLGLSQDLVRYLSTSVDFKISLSTLRKRLYDQLSEHERYDGSHGGVYDVLDAIDRSLLARGVHSGAQPPGPGERHEESSVRLLSDRLFSMSTPSAVASRISDQWWFRLREEETFRGPADVVLAAEACISWLNASPLRGGQQLDKLDSERVLLLTRALCEVLGGGLGFTGVAIDRLAMLIRLVWLTSEDLGKQTLEVVFQLIRTDPGGNSALRSLDRCLRSCSDAGLGRPHTDGFAGTDQRPDLLQSELRLIATIADFALDHFDDPSTWDELWFPDVFAPRLIRVIAHAGTDEQTNRALCLLQRWATALTRIDVGTARACVWALAESARSKIGRRAWRELGKKLANATSADPDTEVATLYSELDELLDSMLDSSSVTKNAFRDFVTTPLQYSIPGWAHGEGVVIRVRSELVRQIVATALELDPGQTDSGFIEDECMWHCWRDGLDQDAPHSTWSDLHPSIRVATSQLCGEMFLTPSAIRLRTINETLENAGPTVRLAVTDAIGVALSRCDYSIKEVPLWFVQRTVHLAGLRGTLAAGAVEEQRPRVAGLAARLEDIVFSDALQQRPGGEFVQARALWSLGDIAARGLLTDPERLLNRTISSRDRKRWQASPPTATAVVRLGALLYASGAKGHGRDCQVLDRDDLPTTIIKLVPELCKSEAVKRTVRWAMRRIDNSSTPDQLQILWDKGLS